MGCTVLSRFLLLVKLLEYALALAVVSVSR